MTERDEEVVPISDDTDDAIRALLADLENSMPDWMARGVAGNVLALIDARLTDFLEYMAPPEDTP